MEPPHSLHTLLVLFLKDIQDTIFFNAYNETCHTLAAAVMMLGTAAAVMMLVLRSFAHAPQLNIHAHRAQQSNQAMARAGAAAAPQAFRPTGAASAASAATFQLTNRKKSRHIIWNSAPAPAPDCSCERSSW
jgi:hypothetical protein